MLDYKSGDYLWHLERWYNSLKEAGGLKGLATYSGDYNPPYVTLIALITYVTSNALYAIKAVSITFDFLLAIAVGKLASYLANDNKKVIFTLAYSICLFIPSVLLNGAFWGQCDSMYTFFIICSLLCLLKEKYLKSFILYGIAFS